MKRLLLLAIASAVVTGCGSSQVGDVEQAAAAFYDAVGAQDGKAVCQLLAPRTREELEQSAQQPCEQAVLDQDIPAAGAGDVRVFGTMAQVRSGAESAFLTRFSDGWRIWAAACTPGGPGGTYDCAVSGG